MNLFKTRVITALIGIPVLLGVLYLGGFYWKGFFTLAALLALYEYMRMMVKANLRPQIIPGAALLLLLLFKPEGFIAPAIFAVLILAVILVICQYPTANVSDLALTFFGAAYIGFLFSYAIDIAHMPQPFLIILLALILTWASDTGAYGAGRLWGKHKMTPVLSPNKTWEGAAGGVILSAIISVLFFLTADMVEVNFAYALILGIAASILAQLGDFFISGVKRYFQVKDTGKILPGHGGVLDRFDSFLLVVPLVYYFALYILF